MSTRVRRLADHINMERLRKAIRDGATPMQISERFGIGIGSARNAVSRIRKELSEQGEQ